MAGHEVSLSDGTMDELDEQFRLLFRRGRAWAARLAAEATPGLDPAVFSVLMAVGRDGLRQASEVAEYFGVGKAAVSRQLTILVESGLVRRDVSEHDARVNELVLTDDGVQLVRDATASIHRSLRRMFDGWSAEETAVFVEHLGRFNDAMR